MSYCVNCGVELDASASACPLCGTTVYHPECPPDFNAVPPYPTVKGSIEPVKTKEFTILMTIIFLTTSAVCLLLNLFAIPLGHWSFYVTAICCVLWIFFIPLFFPQKTGIYVNTAIDGLSIALFLAMVAYLHPGNHWYTHIALPITSFGILLLEIVFLFAIHLKSSMIIKTLISVTAVAVYCMVIETLICLHFGGAFRLRWSAIVATCAAAIDVILLTIYLREGLRSEVRRRMHF